MGVFRDILKGVHESESESEPETRTIRAVPFRAGVTWRTDAGDEYVRREDYEQAREALLAAYGELGRMSVRLTDHQRRLSRLLGGLP